SALKVPLPVLKILQEISFEASWSRSTRTGRGGPRKHSVTTRICRLEVISIAQKRETCWGRRARNRNSVSEFCLPGIERGGHTLFTDWPCWLPGMQHTESSAGGSSRGR